MLNIGSVESPTINLFISVDGQLVFSPFPSYKPRCCEHCLVWYDHKCGDGAILPHPPPLPFFPLDFQGAPFLCPHPSHCVWAPCLVSSCLTRPLFPWPVLEPATLALALRTHLCPPASDWKLWVRATPRASQPVERVLPGVAPSWLLSD